MLNEIVKEGLPILTVEEHALQGGFGSAVLEYIEEVNGTVPYVKRMGIPDRFIEHGSVSQLLEECGLTTDQIVYNVKNMVPKKVRRT